MTTPDLRQQLQSTLGSAYVLERELGGGGMSRVFLAEEVSLGRQVVVKVLPPELAATVNIDRFRREIQLAAQLQHPHIVPLLAAGISDGLPYYTMPFVTGESLRARLARSGELPINDTIRILRDVLSALSYAHEQGIVHRDIKPDNVLLSKHHAVVTDFGVAKALSVATNVGSSLTSVGIALGTPAYMAPEQAAADPATDHRADIYALGAMAYEMLTGYKVFGDRSPQQMLAAHAVEQPTRVETRRPTVPPVLASLVMSALAKRPADRPQSVDEMLATLDSAGSLSGGTGASSGESATRGNVVAATSDSGKAPVDAGGSRPPDKSSLLLSTLARKRNVLVALALLIVAGIAGFAVSMRKGDSASQVLDRELVVVVPFRVAGAEASLSYLREGMLDLLAAKLTGEGGPRAADPRSVLSAWRRVTPSEQEDLSASENVKLAAALGAGQIILGSIVGTPSRLVMNATVFEVPSGRQIRSEATVEGPADSLASLVDQLTVQLLSLQAGEDQQNLAELASASLPAIRAYLDGKVAYRRGRYESATEHFHKALQIDSTFALAAIGLIVSSNWSGGDLIATGVRRAWESREKLSERDRMLLLGYAGLSYPVLPSVREGLVGLKGAAKLGPDQPDLLYEYGDILWHFGGTIGIPNSVKAASDMFARAYALDSSFAPAIEHLVDYAVITGDAPGIARLSARYLALDSVADHAAYIRWRAAVALGDSAALRQVRKKFPSLDLQNAWRIAGTAMLEGIGLRDADAVTAVLFARGEGQVQVQRVAVRLALNRGRQQSARALELVEMQRLPNDPRPPSDLLGSILYWDADRGDAATAVRAVERLALGPLRQRQHGQGRQHIAACTLGLWRLSNNDVKGARVVLPILRSTLRAAQESGYVTTQPTCLPYVETAIDIKLNPARLSANLRKLDAVSLMGSLDFFWIPFNIELARLYETSGDARKALEVIRRRPYHWAEGTEYLTTNLREEGRLAAKAGDREGAVRAYSHYLRLRDNPDAALLPQADSVRAALQRLGVPVSAFDRKPRAR